MKQTSGLKNSNSFTSKIEESFICIHCHTMMQSSQYMGTSHRNHCTKCLWSKHVDKNNPGDRESSCKSGMEPVGLTLKHEGIDKYTGEIKLGDIMLIHICTACGEVNVNRIAADDSEESIMKVFSHSIHISPEVLHKLNQNKIELYGQNKRELIERRLFGRVTEK